MKSERIYWQGHWYKTVWSLKEYDFEHDTPPPDETAWFRFAELQKLKELKRERDPWKR